MEEVFWTLMGNAITKEDKDSMIDFINNTDKFTNGDMVIEFEKKWSEWLGCKHTLYVSSGSTANLLLVSAIKEKYNLNFNDKVLVPCCTWSTNITPIIQMGLKPVFCDINLYDFSFDVECLKKIVEKNTDIKVVFVTHLLGIPADIELYKNILPNAIFIEDCCESHGAEINNIKVGNFSEGSTFSFYFGHHCTTIEGGVVCTNDYDLYCLMKVKRSHGLARELPKEEYIKESKKHPEIDSKFLFLTDGFNFRNTEINAVLGISQLKHLSENNLIRKSNYEKFVNFIKKYPQYFYIPKVNGNSSFCLPVICKDSNFKNRLQEILNKNKIETRPVVGGNLTIQPFLSKYVEIGTVYNNSDILNSNGFYIGNSHFINEKHLDLLFNLIEKTIGYTYE